jgi:hypothetical protein
MSEERNTPGKTSIWRIARAATGGASVLFGVFWIALPFWVFGGPALHKWAPTETLLTPYPYFGLPFICLGLILIRESR